MKIDTTVSFSFVIAFVALLSPIITSYLSKKYELKLKMIELKKGTLTDSYNRMFGVFNNFTDSSYSLMFNLEEIKQNKEAFESVLEAFEKSVNQCLLILNESERRTFESFRILIKTELGYEDPRPKVKSFLPQSLFISNYNTFPFSQLEKEGDKVYLHFNKCLEIANRKLINLEQEELSLLTAPSTKSLFFSPIKTSHLKSDEHKNK